MAEILALIAFPIAAYQTVEKFYEFGEFVAKKISTYNHAPEEIKNVGDFMQDMHEGELRRNMQRMEWVFDQDDVTKFTKTKFSDLLKELKKELGIIQECLDKSFDKKGDLHKKTYTFRYKGNLDKALAAVEKWRLSFWTELQNINTARALPDPLHLCAPQFVPRVSMWNLGFDSTSPIRMGHAEFREKGSVREVSVLIEEVQELQRDSFGIPLNEAKTIATELARKLQFSTIGILRCLGYRDSPKIELVFEIPTGYSNPHTLRQLLVKGRSGRNKDILAPWEYRFRLSRELVIAVYSINAARYVHKNIRPDSIIAFSKTATQPAQTPQLAQAQSSENAISFNILGPTYLMDWRMLREQNTGSSHYGDEVWTRNFYRHPKRQGLDPQERYETKHDVYSLGVCLLELGLWESFIVEKDGVPALSDFFLAAADEHASYPASNFKNTDPHKMIAFCASGKLIGIFKSIAMARLPMNMGTPFAQLVVKCLTNVEGGFGDLGTFTGDKAAANFQSLILNDSSVAVSH